LAGSLQRQLQARPSRHEPGEVPADFVARLALLVEHAPTQSDVALRLGEQS
jgi:hypothetical protein